MRRMSLGLAAVVIAAAAAPAWADKADPYALIATVTAGLSDGGSVAIGELGTGKVSRTGPKAYVVNLPAGQATFIFDQPSPCVFTELSQMKGRPPLTVRFDLGAVSAINFADQGQQGGLNVVNLEFAGDGPIVEVMADDGTAQIAQPQASIITSVPVDELRRAGATLHAACPAQ
jgi:hypothetical protein